jgi:hypothetical protein
MDIRNFNSKTEKSCITKIEMSGFEEQQLSVHSFFS